MDSAYFGDAHAEHHGNRECIWNSGQDIPEVSEVEAVFVAAEVVVVLAGVAEDAADGLVVFEEVVGDVLQQSSAGRVTGCVF